MRGQYFMGLSQAGITLEALDAISTNIDTMTTPWDNYATSVTPEISQFDSNNMLGFFRGSNLEAVLESSEQGTDGDQIRIRGFRPITDAATVYGSVSSRPTQQTAPLAGTEVLVNARTGRCDMNISTRYSRFKTRIPSGVPWSFAAGVEPDIKKDGKR
jgi:hypothetical protein